MDGTDEPGLVAAPAAKKSRKSRPPREESEPGVPPTVTKTKKSRLLLDPSSLLTLQKDTVRRVINQESDLRVSNEAVNLIRFYAEEYIRLLTRKANICAKYRRCRTILKQDVSAAKEMS